MTGSTAVYCSEKYAVVERHRHRFPQLCIWCSSTIADDAMPASPDRDGGIRPPMCRACTATRNRLPRTVGIFGIVTFLAALPAYASFGALVAGALLLTGFIDLVIAWRLHLAARGFRAIREDEQYVWIGGAHAGFLAALPQWHGIKLGEISRH